MTRILKTMSSLTSCRWAFDVNQWQPKQEDWCYAMQSIQPGKHLGIRVPYLTSFQIQWGSEYQTFQIMELSLVSILGVK